MQHDQGQPAVFLLSRDHARILARLEHGGWTSHKALKNLRRGDADRAHGMWVLQSLVAAGEVETKKFTYRGQTGTRYRAAFLTRAPAA